MRKHLDSYKPRFNLTSSGIISLLEKALASRVTLFDSRHETAFRLFNGFHEGEPSLAIELYAKTLVIHNYADDPQSNQLLIDEVKSSFLEELGWLHAVLLKTRHGKTQEEKRGRLIHGTRADTKIKENDIWYAVDLLLNRDTSFYLDTRNLRQWLILNMHDKSFLNAFAYTGSFGVAAMAGKASRVVQLDRNRQFLNMGKDSYSLNGFHIDKKDFVASDFFPQISKLKHTKEMFDCVLLDPPFFSVTSKGRVDQEHESARLINKVRPLINDGGYLIAINNALYISGKEYLQILENLCKDGYLQIKEFIAVPQDFIGYSAATKFVANPTPFNHSTKIAILSVKRK